MIRDSETLREWEKEYAAREPADFFRNLDIFEAMYREALDLGVLPAKDPLEGIEHKIRLAREINALTATAPGYSEHTRL